MLEVKSNLFISELLYSERTITKTPIIMNNNMIRFDAIIISCENTTLINTEHKNTAKKNKKY